MMAEEVDFAEEDNFNESGSFCQLLLANGVEVVEPAMENQSFIFPKDKKSPQMLCFGRDEAEQQGPALLFHQNQQSTVACTPPSPSCTKSTSVNGLPKPSVSKFAFLKQDIIVHIEFILCSTQMFCLFMCGDSLNKQKKRGGSCQESLVTSMDDVQIRKASKKRKIQSPSSNALPKVRLT